MDADNKNAKQRSVDIMTGGMVKQSTDAPEERVKALEKRLKTTLPPSYRHFLLNPKDRAWPGDLRMHEPEQVDWFKAENQDWIDAWTEGAAEGGPISDKDYFVYGLRQDCCHMRSEYLPKVLQISTAEDGRVLLINPVIVDAKGEWEAWDFSNYYPGAKRYRTFSQMVNALEKESDEEE